MLAALRDVESTLTAYSHDQARRETLSKLAAQYQEAVRIAQQQYANGLIDLLDVLEVQRNLYTAQDALAQSDQGVSSDLSRSTRRWGAGGRTKRHDQPFTFDHPSTFCGCTVSGGGPASRTFAKSANPATMRGEAPSSPRAGFADFVLRILDPNPPPPDAPPTKMEGLVC